MEAPRLKDTPDNDRTASYADMFAALGAEPRLRILRVLLAAHPEGMVVGEIQNELGIAASTLSHHLEKLKNEDLIAVRRESTFLRYTANIVSVGGVARIPLRRVLHPQQGHQAGQDHQDMQVEGGEAWQLNRGFCFFARRTPAVPRWRRRFLRAVGRRGIGDRERRSGTGSPGPGRCSCDAGGGHRHLIGADQERLIHTSANDFTM